MKNLKASHQAQESAMKVARTKIGLSRVDRMGSEHGMSEQEQDHSLGSIRAFSSILFPRIDKEGSEETQEPPEFFRDLNLDQVVDTVTSGWDEFNLKPFFYKHLKGTDTIIYRQEVMRDLEDEQVMEAITWFTERMRVTLRYLKHSEDLGYKEQKEGWFLESVKVYGEAVNGLFSRLDDLPLASRGLRSLREFLAAYLHSNGFKKLSDETKKLADDLAAIRYSLIIKGNRITVRDYGGEEDYAAVVEETFRKFSRGEAKDYRREFKGSGMNHVEAWILERVAWLNKPVFKRLEKFSTDHAGYLNDKIARFYREIQFYVAYLGYMREFHRAGLSFCYPQVSGDKEERVQGAFDLALAHNLIYQQGTIVPNGFYLNGPERIIVVSGPNQGGKTTFARMFGQLHYLASIGCPVPGAKARLFLFDNILTHFEREEDIANLRSKLEDDLLRTRQILERATSNSIFIMNEAFASTTVNDALVLSKRILERITQLDALCVFVTFLDELSSLNEKTVSIVSTVDTNDPAVRTYKLERRPADGLAYAIAIARKHGVTYEQLKERIGE